MNENKFYALYEKNMKNLTTEEGNKKENKKEKIF